MGLAFQFQGATGACYTFLLIDMTNPNAHPWQGGAFCFGTNAYQPLYIGEGARLRETMGRAWAELSGPHSLTVAHILLESDAQERARIVADLVERYRPPLNRQK